MTRGDLIKALSPFVRSRPMTLRQFFTLLCLADSEAPIEVGHLASRSKIGKGNMSVAIDYLCISGYAKRRRNEGKLDRRRVFVSITPEGTAFLASMGVS